MSVHFWIGSQRACGQWGGPATCDASAVSCPACKRIAGRHLERVAEALFVLCAAVTIWGLAALPALVSGN